MSVTADKTSPATIGSENGGDRPRETEWMTATEAVRGVNYIRRAADLIVAAQAAEYAGGVGVCTIREACNRNTLRHIRIGGGIAGPIRTRREWVADWLGRWARGGEVH